MVLGMAVAPMPAVMAVAAHCGDDQTYAGFCGGGGDCCEVGVGTVAVALVKRCCLACLLQVLEAQ